MRHSQTFVAASLVLALCAHAASAAVRVRAVVDHDRVFVGEPFTLTIEVDGTQQAEAPELGAIQPFDVSYIGPTTRFSSVNGTVTTSVSHRYALTAKREGTYRLGPFRVSADGSVHEAPALEVWVSPRTSAGGVAPGQDQIRLVVTPEKTTAFVGERIPFSVELYIGDVAADNLHFPDVEADGFAIDTFAQPARREEISGNRRWTVIKFSSTATALRPGTLEVGPTTLALNVRERARSRGSFFDDLIAAGRARSIELLADPATIEVRPLPAENRPADFSGAVGAFNFTVNVNPTEVAAGDPITVRMDIKGVGNLASVAPPRVPVGEEFRAYEPTVVADGAGPGRLSVEQVLIPRDASVRQLPAIRFSFFEPESGTYRSIARGPVPIVIRPPAESAKTGVIGGEAPAPSAAAPEKLGRDIVYMKDKPGDLGRSGPPLYARWWFAALQVTPLASVAGLALVMRRRRVLSADPRLARQQRAGKVARQRLSQLSATAREPAFYDELTAAVTRYLADKLDLPPGAVDRANVAARLDVAGAPAAVRQNAARFFDVIEQARYAPGASGDGDRGEALDLARALVHALERDRRVARRLGVACVLLAAASIAAAGSLALAESSGEASRSRDPHTIFYEGNTAYKNGEYAEAAREYERLLAAGFVSGELHYNLGNAYFKQGMYGRAILAYERARRLMPRDADIGANLAYARENAKSPAPDPPWWQRFVFAPAMAMSTSEIAVAWTVLWCGAWVLVALGMLGRRGAGSAAPALWVALVIVGASFAFRLWRYDLADDAIVTSSGSAVARFEPSPGGKEYFKVPEGSELSIRRTRSGWVQVARADGLRGWMASDQLERID